MMVMLLQVCVLALGVSLASPMTSDPAYYSQTPLRPRPTPLLQLSYPQRTGAAYTYTPRASRLYDTDYTGRQMRYRTDLHPMDRRVASYQYGEGNDAYPQPMSGGYRKQLSYEAPAYADDRGRIAGNYMMLGSRGFGSSRPFQEERQAPVYMGDSSLI